MATQPVVADNNIFDDIRLEASLRGDPPSVQEFRQALASANACLREQFDADAPVALLLSKRAWLVDQLLIRAWALHIPHSLQACLLAVGGYGRGELHPGSDVDIAIIVKRVPNTESSKYLKSFLAFLWDIGMEVGHSVRTPRQCRVEARADITIATNLMEARFLSGYDNLRDAVLAQTGPDKIWSTKAFYKAKLAAQIERHKKYNDTSYNLEPNLKEGPGGLRDLQTVGWIARRYFGANSLTELVEHGFLTGEEHKTLAAGQSFLWQVRYALHLIAARREDRLLFDYQRLIAERLGYRDVGRTNHGVEQFMKNYYRTVTELRRLNEILIELLYEEIFEKGRKVKVRILNNRFQTHNNLIEARDPHVFRRYRFALLEIFLLIQQNAELEGIRASTLRLIRDNLHLIDQDFRNDLRARSLFIEIIRQPRRLGHELQRMQRYGVLGAYLPVFEAVSGLMQFDLFHVYTVDEHTLTVVRNMRHFWFPVDESLPLCCDLVQQLPKPELLYIAGLFHDIAKGRGGDHSKLGADEAIEFCTRHQLGKWDTSMVSWLVRHHLLMSVTAQKKDIADPAVINEFAEIVGDRTHLDYLYLLTVADIRGTNPKLWTSWKDALLQELYFTTVRALRRGLENPFTRRERIEETKGEVLATLGGSDLSVDAVESLWSHLEEDYFLRHTPDEILWHAEGILHAEGSALPVVQVREETDRGSTEIFVYSRDRDHLFALVTHTLDQLGLTIQDARIITSGNGYTLDTFFVLEAGTGKFIKGEKRAEEICKALHASLKSEELPAPRVNRRLDRKLRHFSIPTQVSFEQDPANLRTIMEVVTTDTPGVLSRIGMAMQSCEVRLQNARIATYGERAEDIFYITDTNNEPITDPLNFERLRDAISDALRDR